MMSEPVKLNTFPNSAIEALALLYVQSQDLSGKTPADVLTMYYEAKYQMQIDQAQKMKSGWIKTKDVELQQA